MAQEMSTPGKEFAKLVRKMRAAQSLFFKNKSSLNLERARALEKQVDAVIKSLNLPEDGKMQNQTLQGFD